MSLESPQIKITDWNNYINRLKAIEAALGMTNKDALAEAAGQLSDYSLFKFVGETVPTSQVTIVVKSISGEFDGTGISKDVVFEWNDAPANSRIHPIFSFKVNGAAKFNTRAMLIGNVDKGYYLQGEPAVVRVFSHDADLAPTSKPFGFTITMVGFCVASSSVV